MSDKYTSKNTNRENTNLQIQIEKYKSEKYEPESANREIQIGKIVRIIQIGNIQFRQYKLENTC